MPFRYLNTAERNSVVCREPDWGVWEIFKLVLMGFLWGAVVLGVIHFSMWAGAWWDDNIGTPGKPNWRGQKIFSW